MTYTFLPKAPVAKVDRYWSSENAESTERIDHQLWQDVLDDYLILEHASGVNRIAYQELSEDLETLDQYIDIMTAIDPRQFNRAEQFAYWVNLYNALTLQLVATHYPIESITELGQNPLSFGPWDEPIATIVGKEVTLNDIEHRILRPLWKDYRIHFAVNCASIGCPNLLPTAFTAENTETLLETAANDYLGHSRGLSFQEDQLVLSSIFQWYATDFGNTQQQQLATLAKHSSPSIAELLKQYSDSIEYVYNWQLNDE